MPKKILIADDAAFMRMLIRDILVKEGYEVIEACNGSDAFKQYELHRPDLVTLDITMPEVDGLAGLKMIKSVYPDANVIMCSAMGQQAMVVEAIQYGAKDFIVKPFEKTRVLDAVRKVIG